MFLPRKLSRRQLEYDTYPVEPGATMNSDEPL
jgi:hypothetical protein